MIVRHFDGEPDVYKRQAVKNAKENNSALHFMGLLSDGGVHSHITHLFGLLELAKREGLEKVYVHCFLDGRDTPPASGKGYIEELQAKMKEIGVGEIATVSGRYYAMDRDNRWDRVELAFKAMTKGEGVKGTDAAEAVPVSYTHLDVYKRQALKIDSVAVLSAFGVVYCYT